MRQLPEGWDRYDAIEYVESEIIKQDNYFRVRVTSINIIKEDVYCDYEYYRTTSRYETPSIGRFLLPLKDLESHIRDIKIKKILE